MSFFNGMILDSITQKERCEFEFRLVMVQEMERRARKLGDGEKMI